VDPEEVESQIDTLDLINTEVTASLASLSDTGARVDTKAIVLVGYAGAAATFLATWHANTNHILAILAYIAYGAAAACGIGVFAVSTFMIVPDPQELVEGYGKQPKAKTLLSLVATKAQAFKINVSRNTKKVQLWRASLIALACGMPLMLVSIIVHNSRHG
jgi:hypothetical protein